MVRIKDRNSIAIVFDYLQSMGYYQGRDWRFKMGSLYRENMIIGVMAITAQPHCPEIETVIALKFGELMI